MWQALISMGLPAPEQFTLEARVVKAHPGPLGLVLGWSLICTEGGERYGDLHGDHVPDESMLRASTEFMKGTRQAKAMHDGEPVGEILFAWPMTREIADAFGVKTERTGLMTAMLPHDHVRKGFLDGTYTGFSIGGKRQEDEILSATEGGASTFKTYGKSQPRDATGSFLCASVDAMQTEHDQNLSRMCEIGATPEAKLAGVREHAQLAGRNAELRHLISHSKGTGF